MAGFVAIARFDKGVSELPIEIEEGSDGLLGISLWRHAEQEQQNILVLSFRDAQASQELGRRLISRILDQPNKPHTMPDSVSHIGLKDQGGVAFAYTVDGGYMLLGNVVANPGMGEGLHTRLAETATSVEMLPEYSGHARGSDIANNDDVWFFGFWKTVPSLMLPPDLEGKGGLYQKVGSRVF